MLNMLPSAGFCIRGAPQAAGWNSNPAIQIHLDTSVYKTSRATVQRIDFVLL